MRDPVRLAGDSFVPPVLHGLNRFGTVRGVELAIGQQLPEAAYELKTEIPTSAGEAVLEPGMTFAFEPNCAFGRRVVHLGGTVILGEDRPIELNPRTRLLVRVDA